MKQRTFHHQQGIALGPILFIIAILAILAAAIAAGGGGFTANTQTEGSKVNASTIIQVATNLQTAVQNVMSHGCADTQINFANPVISGYTNSNAPSDNSCNVFDPNGGAISFPTITASTLETNDGGQFVFEGSNGFTGLGNAINNVPALAAFLPVDSKNVCQEINNLLGLGQYWSGAWYYLPSGGFGHFTGTYVEDNGITSEGLGNWPEGKMMGCLQEAYNGVYNTRPNDAVSPYVANYFFFVVLLVR